MNFKKQHIVLVLIGALILGFGGAYFGVQLAQSNQTQNTEKLVQNNSGEGQDVPSEKPKDMDKVVQAYNLIKQNYLEDVEGQQLIEGAVQGMLDTLEDPYSTYMDVETMKNFNETIESSFEGIGAEVSMVNDTVTIIAPIKDSPAEEAGLRPNDQVLSVDNESIQGLDLFEAVEKIRGKKGSEVVLEIKRPGVSEPFNVTLTRDNIPLETVYSEMKTIDGKKTGVIEITTFSEKTAEDFKKQLSDLEDNGIEGLVIDVRGNPGGLLQSVEEILKQFITEDMPYVQIEDGNGKKTPYYSQLKEKKPYPISVLVNEGSASASEILAVAMKEAGYDVVGTKSYGKGTVQKAIPFGDGSTIKLTFYKWLSPEGNWIHEKGVKPTIKVEQPDYYYSNPIQIKEPLTYNHTGEKIKNIQIMLRGLGYNPDRNDGYYNKETVEAVKSFQSDFDLEVTGEVDKETAGLIESKIVEKISSGKDDKQLEKALNSLY
ncbi:S41 family peptidase [Virgibacillus necropolis]|uniref:Peptidase S41 n=1 Tax=Virgibacillus necropolis TaxID=163877 RepID=A0A221MAW0_9BACI|nr:S41 family peptidase [Virgibacillus necropolis]ASN04740.1 peptidase S41 [Virgibacillus necropolis]